MTRRSCSPSRTSTRVVALSARRTHSTVCSPGSTEMARPSRLVREQGAIDRERDVRDLVPGAVERAHDDRRRRCVDLAEPTFAVGRDRAWADVACAGHELGARQRGGGPICEASARARPPRCMRRSNRPARRTARRGTTAISATPKRSMKALLLVVSDAIGIHAVRRIAGCVRVRGGILRTGSRADDRRCGCGDGKRHLARAWCWRGRGRGACKRLAGVGRGGHRGRVDRGRRDGRWGGTNVDVRDDADRRHERRGGGHRCPDAPARTRRAHVGLRHLRELRGARLGGDRGGVVGRAGRLVCSLDRRRRSVSIRRLFPFDSRDPVGSLANLFAKEPLDPRPDFGRRCDRLASLEAPAPSREPSRSARRGRAPAPSS